MTVKIKNRENYCAYFDPKPRKFEPAKITAYTVDTFRGSNSKFSFLLSLLIGVYS